MTKKPLLIYLHGLNSSPQSFKSQQTVRYIKDNNLDIEFWSPHLPNEPDRVKHLLLNRMASERTARAIYIFGSSLGGYIGTWLFDTLQSFYCQHSPRLVLINPAVKPYDLFEEYRGPQVNHYTGEKWYLTKDHVEQLKQLDVDSLSLVERILLLVQTGDELLDYREAVERYAHSVHFVQEGGSHSFDHYEKVLPAIFDFLGSSGISKYRNQN